MGEIRGKKEERIEVKDRLRIKVLDHLATDRKFAAGIGVGTRIGRTHRDAAHVRGMVERHELGDRAAGRCADEMGRSNTEMLDQRGHIACVLGDRVTVLRARRLSGPAMIWEYDKMVLRETLNLRAETCPRAAQSGDQHDRRLAALAEQLVMQRNAL